MADLHLLFPRQDFDNVPRHAFSIFVFLNLFLASCLRTFTCLRTLSAGKQVLLVHRNKGAF